MPYSCRSDTFSSVNNNFLSFSFILFSREDICTFPESMSSWNFYTVSFSTLTYPWYSASCFSESFTASDSLPSNNCSCASQFYFSSTTDPCFYFHSAVWRDNSWPSLSRSDCFRCKFWIWTSCYSFKLSRFLIFSVKLASSSEAEMLAFFKFSTSCSRNFFSIYLRFYRSCAAFVYLVSTSPSFAPRSC